jgi:hypothetical protein
VMCRSPGSGVRYSLTVTIASTARAHEPGPFLKPTPRAARRRLARRDGNRAPWAVLVLLVAVLEHVGHIAEDVR